MRKNNLCKWHIRLLLTAIVTFSLFISPVFSVKADIDNWDVKPDSSSTYVPTNIINGDFQTRPWMKYEYGGTQYFSSNNINMNLNTTINESMIYANGVDKGWNTSEQTTQNGDLFEWLNGVGQGTGNWTGYNPKLTFTADNYFVELNAANSAVLYQDLTTHEGDVIRWSFKHAVRTNGGKHQETQNMKVFVGAPNFSNGIPVKAHGINNSINHEIQNSDTMATYTSEGTEGKYAFANTDELAALMLTKTNNADKWYTARGVYIIPAGQDVTRFAFMSMGQDNAGNLMDDVTFSTLIGNLKATVSDNGDVTVTGYWGETDSAQKLVIDIGGSRIPLDMTSVQGKNFRIDIPADIIGDATTVTIYHEDYQSAKKTVTLEHQHKWKNVVNGNVITVYCENTAQSKYCSNPGEENSVSITLNAEDTLFKTGAYVAATVDAAKYNAGFGTSYSADDVVYYLSDGTTKTTPEDNGALTTGGAPSLYGAYVAKITVAPIGGGEAVTATKAFNITLKSEAQIPVRAVLDETPDFDVSGMKLTFKLTPVNATTLNDTPLYTADRMPMPETDTVEISCPDASGVSNAVGYVFGDSNNPWRFDLTEAGKYIYEVSYVASDDNAFVCSKKNTIVIYAAADGAVKYDLNRPIEELTADSFSITQGMNAGGEFTIIDGEATLRIGGTTPCNTDGFDSAAAKTKFAIDFTQSFMISGRILMSKVPDGAALGFVPSGVAQKQNEVQKWWCNGVFGDAHGSGLTTVPVNGNGIFLEFDSWGNVSSQGGEDQGTIENLNTGINGKHIGLLRTDANGEPVNDSVASHLACINGAADSAWPSELTPYSITFNKDTKALTFRVGDSITITWNNPVEVFGTDKAYFVMGANIRFGPVKDASYGLSNTTQYSSLSFTNVCYTNEGQASIDNIFEMDIKPDRTDKPSVSMDGYTYGQTEALPIPGLMSEVSENPSVVYYYNTTDSTAGASVWENIKSDTLDAGTYYMFARLGTTAGYRPCTTATKSFTILPESNSWITEPAIADVYYGTPVSAVYEAKLGNATVVVNYEGVDGTAYTGGSTAPTAPGNYKAIFTVAETKNYRGLSKEIKFKINKIEATVLNAPAANNRTYDGTVQALITVGTSDDGKLQYKLGTDGTYADNVPVATDAGIYTVYYKVIGDSCHIDSAEKPIQVTISPLDVSEAFAGVFEPMTYTGNVQIPVAAVTVNGLTATGEWSSVKNVSDTTTFAANGNFTGVIANKETGMTKASVTAPVIASRLYNGSLQIAEVPASELYLETANNGGTSVGGYDVVLTIKDPSNYKWTDSEDAEKILIFFITREENSWIKEPAIADVSFGTPVKVICEAEFGNDTVTITYEGIDGTLYESNAVAPTAAGNYKATFAIAPTADYGELSKEVKFKINKTKAAVLTAPEANLLTYNGAAQALVTAGTTNDGRLQYKLGTDGTYSDAVPAAADAGTYTVYYKIIADSNHIDSDEDSIEVKISPLNITGAAAGSFTPMTYTGGAQTPSAAVTIGTLNVTGSWSSVTNVADTTTFTATGNFTGTLTDQATGMAKVSVTAPSIAGKVNNGELQTAEVRTSALYTVAANNGGIEAGFYDVVLVLTDSANYRWTDSETADKTLKFEISARPKYAINGYADEFGNAVTADFQNAEKDTKVALTVIPAAEYTLNSLEVKNVSGAAITLTVDNTFIMPESEVTVNAVFTQNTYNITGYGDTAGNSVTANLAEATRGTKITLAVSAATGYKFISLTVKDAAGNPIAVTADNTFIMPGTAAAVTAVFEKPDIIPIPVGKVKTDDTEKNDEKNDKKTDGKTGGKTDGKSGEKDGAGTEKKDALVIDVIVSKDADTGSNVETVVESIKKAISENGTKNFTLKADEQTVTEQGIENKAYADSSTEEITEITKPAETRSVKLESAVIEALADAEETESLTVMTSVADVEFDAQTIESISEQSNGSVQLVVTLIKEVIEKESNGENKVYFAVSLIKEDGTEITYFEGGKINVTVPIPKACQNEPVVVVYTDNKGHYSPVNGRVNSDGTYTFITEHLSEYILMTQSEAEKLYNHIFDFSTLKAHSEKRSESSVTLDWEQYEDADGYIIYGNYCNHDGKICRVKKIATITDPSVTEYTVDGLEKGTRYKFRIKAYKLVNGSKYITIKSRYVHTVTLGGKQRVTTDIKLDRTGMKKNGTVTLKEGQTCVINAESCTDTGKAVHHVSLRYESSDASVATVSLKEGVITAVGKGTCTVFVIAENGLYEEITVKVNGKQ